MSNNPWEAVSITDIPDINEETSDIEAALIQVIYDQYEKIVEKIRTESEFYRYIEEHSMPDLGPPTILGILVMSVMYLLTREMALGIAPGTIATYMFARLQVKRKEEDREKVLASLNQDDKTIIQMYLSNFDGAKESNDNSTD